MLKEIFSNFGIYTAVHKIYIFMLMVTAYPKWHTLRKKEKICLELGSGARKGEDGWVTVDLFGADISHDLRRGIPLPSESVDRIYTSHMLEHIPYKDLVIFINDCFRVLKRGGQLSVCVPDASLYIRAYVEGTSFLGQGSGFGPAIVDTGSLMDQINYIAYMDQHHSYMFDSENLVNTLKKAPFYSVDIREFDEDLDLKCRDYESIYANAVK